jgi:uncharacterized membrane protein
MIKTLHWGAVVSLLLLIFVCLAWETMLAPLKPGGSMLMLKTIPLLFPLLGVLKGRLYTFQWASMLVLIYFTEGVVRAWSDQGLSAQLAMAEVFLAVIFFICSVFYAKHTKKQPS